MSAMLDATRKALQPTATRHDRAAALAEVAAAERVLEAADSHAGCLAPSEYATRYPHEIDEFHRSRDELNAALRGLAALKDGTVVEKSEYAHVPDTGDPRWLEAHARLLEVHRVKSRGYGTEVDKLANFTLVGRTACEPASRYPRRRMLEKLARCESLDRQGRFNEIPEELEDVASLALCALALMARDGYPMSEDEVVESTEQHRRGPAGQFKNGVWRANG